MEAVIALNYVNPLHPTAFGSVKQVHKYYFPAASLTQVKNALSNSESYTKKRAQRKIKKHIPIYMYFKRQQFQIDLIETGIFKSENSGIRYLFNIIDATTRFVWMLPCKSKKAPEIASKFEAFLNTLSVKPGIVFSDFGGEFTSNLFENLLNKFKIKHIFPKTSSHCATVERSNRTIQNMLYKYLESKSNNRYIDHLQDIVNLYNNKMHRIIGMHPSQAEQKKNHPKLINNLVKYYSKALTWGKKKQKERNINVGDTVRAAVEKKTFHRGYNNQFSDELYIVKKIDFSKHIPLYYLTSQNNPEAEVFPGGYYEEELQHVFRSDKKPLPKYFITKTKLGASGKKNIHVKWEGLDQKFSSWYPESFIQKQSVSPI
jgi:hypothetical protein